MKFMFPNHWFNLSHMRYFLQIAYRGTAYHGWQVQHNALGVQAVIDDCLTRQLGETISSTGCCRTDTGVHAKKLFMHFDLEKELPENFKFKFNSFLPRDIVVHKVFKAPLHFSARKDAIKRTYRYYISQQKNPFLIGFVGFVWEPLDIDKMNEAAKQILLYNDFETFSKANSQTEHYLCDMFSAGWHKTDNQIYFEISANRFLRGMVRMIVGTLLQVGRGNLSVDEFAALIERKNRHDAGAAVPADGLYLWDVEYPAGKLEEI